MRKALFWALGLLIFPLAGEAGEPPARTFEGGTGFVAKNVVDEAVLGVLRARRIEPANPCSDQVFVRRVFLDVIGTLPKPAEVLAFLQDRAADKRARLIDALLLRDEFAEYNALRWCDILRVKAEFPINLWPNAVQAYHRWIRDAVKENWPYDRMARLMLTASGSNFRVPAVNFWRASPSREPAFLAKAVALTFMGARYGRWPEARRTGMATFFTRVAFKRTVEWKEEIVHLDPAPGRPVQATLPDGQSVWLDGGSDPRRVFADWLIRRDNPWFAACAVNRVWTWLMGRGIVHEPDDFRPDNPPSNPALLAVLQEQLVRSGYDLRQLYRLILNSSTYQQSPIPRSKHADAEKLFAHYIVRRLDAEVLVDALCAITGTTERYVSPIPEPFTFVPEDNRSIALTDGSITSPILELLGRPNRDTGLWSERNNKCTNAQRLHLLNSSDIQNRIERSPRLAAIFRGPRRKPGRVVHGLYLLILSRPATDAEVLAVQAYGRTAKLGAKQVADDLVWALINSKEFLYAH